MTARVLRDLKKVRAPSTPATTLKPRSTPLKEAPRMALAFYFAPTSVMTAQQYDECTRRLAQAGVGRPKDRLYHACFGTPESVSVFDVWTSQAAFDAFGQTLMPILQEMGIDVGQPSVMPIHNVIVPAPPKARV